MFTPILREMIQFDLRICFQMGGLNHQLVEPRNSSGGHILAKRLEPHCGSKRKTPTWQHSSLVGIEVWRMIHPNLYHGKMVGNHHFHPFQRGWFFRVPKKDPDVSFLFAKRWEDFLKAQVVGWKNIYTGTQTRPRKKMVPYLEVQDT